MNISRIMAYGVYTTGDPADKFNRVRSLRPLLLSIESRQNNDVDFALKWHKVAVFGFGRRYPHYATSCNSTLGPYALSNSTWSLV